MCVYITDNLEVGIYYINVLQISKFMYITDM